MEFNNRLMVDSIISSIPKTKYLLTSLLFLFNKLKHQERPTKNKQQKESRVF